MKPYTPALPLLFALLAPIASAAPIPLSVWATTPLTVGGTTFTYLSNSGVTLDSAQVEAMVAGSDYRLALSSLIGALAATFELKYLVEIAGAGMMDTVGLDVVAAAATTSATADYFSDQYFNTIAAQPQEVINTGRVTDGIVDGNQSRLWVRLTGALSAPSGSLSTVANDFIERTSIPAPSTPALAVSGLVGLCWFCVRGRRERMGQGFDFGDLLGLPAAAPGAQRLLLVAGPGRVLRLRVQEPVIPVRLPAAAVHALLPLPAARLRLRPIFFLDPANRGP